MRGAQNSIGKIIGDQALVVIRENQRIQMLQRAEKKRRSLSWVSVRSGSRRS